VSNKLLKDFDKKFPATYPEPEKIPKKTKDKLRKKK